ncbi:MAG: hypothetical protein WBC05_21565 [Sedimentisphaerales bacterium]
MVDKRIFLLFVLTWAMPLWAQNAIVRSVQLKPVVWPRAGLRIDFDYRFVNALPPFEREPDFGQNETARGIIPTVPPTGFIRNITDNELLLDLDHDQDFVANPPVSYKSIYDGHVVFKEIQVNTVRQGLTIPYTLTLYTYEHGCSGWFIVRSAWSGQFELAGRRWSMQVIDNLNGVFDSNDLMSLFEITSDGRRLIWASRCNAAKRIVLAGHTYDLSCVFQDEQGSVLLNAAFTEVTGDLGTIQIEAQGVESLSLRNEQCLVLLNPSDTNAIIPEGDYHIDSCLLKDDPNFNGYPRFMTDDRIITVRSGSTTSLAVGTPLTNTITVNRHKNHLQLAYGLQGLGEEQYQFYNWKNRPSFDVYKGPIKIASRRFGYG